MKTSFEKFIEKNYKGLNLISIPSEAYKPGVIVNDDDRVFSHLSRFINGGINWDTKEIAANMANLTVTGERKLDLGASVLGFITLKGGIDTDYSVAFEFSDVSQEIFDYENNGPYESDIRIRIQALKDANREAWLMLLHKFVTMEVVIVHSATVEFKKNGSVVPRAQYSQLEQDISINGAISWNKEGKLEIVNEKNLPFGLMGFQVKRSM
ncbi:MAG: hypothetical protein ACOYXB_07405 [Bacteroidota bacterium]